MEPNTTDIYRLVAAGMKPSSARQALINLGSLVAVASANSVELQRAGVPEKTADKLAAAFAIGRTASHACERFDLAANASSIYDRLRPRIAGVMQEVFFVIALDSRSRIIDVIEVARGTLIGVEVHPREVFRPAMRLAAAGIVVAHNHPSGDPTPSEEDIALTRRLREVGMLVGIPVIDHVVVAASGYRSIAEYMGTAL